MNMPLFTAEASLYRTSGHYRSSGSECVDLRFGESIVPAYFPGSATREKCSDCFETCVETLLLCEGAGLAACGVGCIWSLFAYGACFAGCFGPWTAACSGAAVSCELYCATRKCCPKACEVPNPFNPGQGCCDSGEQCVDESDPNARGGCCPSGQSVCGGKCCLPGDICCGDACCPAGFNCQQGVCCPPDKPNVCSGICCAGPCDQNGVCCEAPGYMCGGKCCFGECCNGQCCELASGKHCHPTLGTCCSTICGPSCCPEGQFCQNPTLGTCGQCGPGEHACPGEAHCCPDGSNCCPGGICCWGSGCCRRPDGTWGCCPPPR